jgi:hypothetical protein
MEDCIEDERRQGFAGGRLRTKRQQPGQEIHFQVHHQPVSRCRIVPNTVLDALSSSAICHGMSHLIGQVAKGCMADLVVWKPENFGAKPEMIIKGGVIAWATVRDCIYAGYRSETSLLLDGRGKCFYPDSPTSLRSADVGGSAISGRAYLRSMVQQGSN